MRIFGFKFGENAFDLKIENPEFAFQQARGKIQLAGGNMTGDSINGQFSVRGVEGEYRQTYGVIQPTYRVTITRKPWLVSYGYIEQKVREYFQGA